MIRKELDHVSLSVDDFEAVRPFYEEVLGLERDPARPAFGFPGAWYQLGGCQIHLIQRPDGVDTGTRAPGLTPVAPHVAIRVDDYDAAVAYFKGHGIEVFETNADNGQLWVRDPAGNIIELTAR
jgi:catechol 2,3-dioxygenase-like lactoylglutathione lyase family enzyme